MLEPQVLDPQVLGPHVDRGHATSFCPLEFPYGVACRAAEKLSDQDGLARAAH